MLSKAIAMAIQMRNQSYAPYSQFRVGAALVDLQGNIYTGCNIENAAYSPTICAERTAFAKAVSEGVRAFSFIVISAGKDDLTFCPPCGVCRQFMSEFCNMDEFRVILAKSTEEYKEYTLSELLPHSFGAEGL